MKTPEVAFVVKSRRELVDAVVARVKAMHSYSCPCVIASDIDGRYHLLSGDCCIV